MYLIDTNIIIYFLNDNLPAGSYPKMNNIFSESFNISVITKMEVLGFTEHTELSYKKAKRFIDNANILEINDEIVEKVINIKRKKKVRLPDAIIAACAVNNNLTLITRNVDDFKGLGLKIFNPFETF